MNWSDKLKGVAHEVDKHRLVKPKRTFGDLNDNKKKPKLAVVKEDEAEIQESPNFYLHSARYRAALEKSKSLGYDKSTATIQKHVDRLDSPDGHKYYKEYMRKKGLKGATKTSVPSVKEESVPANCVQGDKVAGLTGDPPVKKKRRMAGVVRRG